MLDMTRKIVTVVKTRTRADFDSDEILRLALTHMVQVIGEAAGHVSQSFRSTHPEIPWRAIVGMRQKVVHDYLAVDDDMVWDTVTREIPALVARLEKVVES
jgi:uncharacterized protein with HEPN domain